MFRPTCVLFGSKVNENSDDAYYFPLNTFSVDVMIVNNLANVSVNTTFINRSGSDVISYYEYFFGSGCTFGECSVKIGNKHHYITKVESDILPALQETTYPMVDHREEFSQLLHAFSSSIGIVPQNESVVVNFQFEYHLSIQDGEIVFSLPSYSQNAKNIKVESFKIFLEMNSIIDNVVSVNHKYTFEPDPKNEKKARVIPKFDTDKSIRDFLLHIQLDDDTKPLAILEKGVSTQALAVTFIPPVKDFGEPRNEIFFIIDCSESMDNDRWQYVIGGVSSLITRLPSNTPFNIIGFGSNFHICFPESTSNTVENVNMAKEYLAHLQPDLGRTTLLTVLLYLYSIPVNSDRLRQIWLFSDGDILDKYGCIQHIRRNTFQSTLSTFGIISHIHNPKEARWMQYMATTGLGQSVLVADKDKFILKISESLDLLVRSPVLYDIEFKASCNVPIYSPFRHNIVTIDHEITFFGLLIGTTDENITVTISAKTFGKQQPLTYKINIKKQITPSITVVHKHTINAIMKDMDHKRSIYHNSNGFLNNPLHFESFQQEQTQLSLLYQSVCQFTNIVGIKEDVNGAENKQKEIIKIKPRGIGVESYELELEDYFKTFYPVKLDSLAKIMDGGEFTLEEILPLQEFNTYCEERNPMLIAFLKRPRIIRKLFTLVVTCVNEPSFAIQQKCTKLLTTKYLWSDCIPVIVTSECLGVIFSLFNSDIDYSDYILWKTMENVCLLITHFMMIDSGAVIRLLRDEVNPFDILKHSHHSSVADLLTTLINDPGSCTWIYNDELINNCVTRIASENVEIQEKAYMNLVSIISKGILTQTPEIMIDRLFQISESSNNFFISLKFLSYLFSTQSFLQYLCDTTFIDPLTTIISSKLPHLKQILAQPQQTRPGPAGPIAICKQERIMIVEFITSLIQLNMSQLNQVISKSNIIMDIFEVFFKYPLNNIYHGYVLKLVLTCFKIMDKDLIAYIIRDMKLLDMIISGWKKSQCKDGSNRGELSYSGYLMNMSRTIDGNRPLIPVDDYIESHKDWNEFVSCEYYNIKNLQKEDGMWNSNSNRFS